MTKSKEELRPQQPKQPRKVNVATIVPWFIVTVLLTLVIAFVAGWHVHKSVDDMASVEAKQYADLKVAASLKASR